MLAVRLSISGHWQLVMLGIKGKDTVLVVICVLLFFIKSMAKLNVILATLE
jgi:hypothetical protein